MSIYNVDPALIPPVRVCVAESTTDSIPVGTYGTLKNNGRVYLNNDNCTEHGWFTRPMENGVWKIICSEGLIFSVRPAPQESNL